MVGKQIDIAKNFQQSCGINVPELMTKPLKKAFLEIYYLKKHLIYKKLAEKVANTKIYL